MSEDIKNCPRLRFPRFKGPWVSAPLDSISTISSGLTNEQVDHITPYKVSRIETISSGFIDINKIGYIEYNNNISSSKLNIGDILFSNINSTSHIGKSAYVSSDINLYHGINLLRIVTNKKNYSKFIFYIINTNDYRESFRQRANKAVNQASINQRELGKTLIKLPQYEEQQKIADCLSSIDELIEAHEQKLDALKQHKKGLMQRLFPAKSETTPHWRFPEFRNTGDWMSITLGELCSISTGKKDANQGNNTGLYPFFTCAEKTIYSNTYSFNGEALLIAGNANVGLTKYYNGKFEAYQRTYVLMNFKKININYLYIFLKSNLQKYLKNIAQLSAMQYIKLPMLKEYIILLPKYSKEQQKIADCLTSVDEHIKAQEEKIAALKEHKRGLMQQLFPSL